MDQVVSIALSDSSISDNFVKNLLTQLSLASHKFSNSARLQVAFRSDTFTLFFKQPRKKCSFKSSIPENIFSTTQSFNFFPQRRKSWRQGSGVAWLRNCWTGDNCINSKAVTNCFQRVFMFIVQEYSTFNATEEKQDFLHQLSDFFKVRT